MLTQPAHACLYAYARTQAQRPAASHSEADDEDGSLEEHSFMQQDGDAGQKEAKSPQQSPGGLVFSNVLV